MRAIGQSSQPPGRLARMIMAGARAHDRLVKGTAGHTCPASAPPSRDKPLQQLAVYDWPAGCTRCSSSRAVTISFKPSSTLTGTLTDPEKYFSSWSSFSRQPLWVSSGVKVAVKVHVKRLAEESLALGHGSEGMEVPRGRLEGTAA